MPKVKQYERLNGVLASNIAKYRALSGTTVKDFARALGFSESTMYPKLREKGMNDLRLWELRLIAQTMHVSLQELLEGVK